MPTQSPRPTVFFNSSLTPPGDKMAWVRRLPVVSMAVLLVACGKTEAPAGGAPGGHGAEH